MAKPAKKTGPKKAKRNVPNGVAHIQSTFNNTIVSITDTAGEVISWSSAGASGFKGARKGTPLLPRPPPRLPPAGPSNRACVRSRCWFAVRAPAAKPPSVPFRWPVWRSP